MRETKDWKVPPDGGRDAGKVFRLTEMAALPAEKWAYRAISAMVRSGVEIEEFNIENPNTEEGMRTLATLTIKAFAKIPFSEAEPLLDEMMACVQIQPNPDTPDMVRQMLPGEIEEVATLAQLRMEVFKLHTGFFTKGATRSK